MAIQGMSVVLKRDPVAQFRHAYEQVARSFSEEQRAAIEQAINEVALREASPGQRAAYQPHE
jgi:hypothetical protein